MPAEVPFDPDVFHGELTANRAQLFVRAPRTSELEGCTLHGYVHGPRCEYSHTLPARYVLNDLGPGPTLLARATITDPCYWTSDLPQLYDVHIEVRRGSEVVGTEKRLLGLRGIGSAAKYLVREGKVWVPRGVSVDLLPEQNLVDQLRSELLVGVCSSPSLDLLNEASRRGAYLIANLNAAQTDLVQALRGLARWPAVLMAVVHGGARVDGHLQQVAPNLLLAQPISAGESELQPAAWASVAVAEEPAVAALARQWPVPVMAQHSLPGWSGSGAMARAECDRLQRVLACTGQFAGYLIAGRGTCSGN